MWGQKRRVPVNITSIPTVGESVKAGQHVRANILEKNFPESNKIQIYKLFSS